MAEAFLDGLPRVRRGVLGRQDQRCSICMEDYGTTPSANGIIERAVRLPCHHVLGSMCISSWVSSPAQGGAGNNTCPLCRHELFQTEHPLTPFSPNEHDRLEVMLVERCLSICALIGLQASRVPGTAIYVAGIAYNQLLPDGAGPENAYAVAAASVFMASHLTNHAMPIRLIASCFHDVEDALIARTYILLRNHMRDVIIAEMPAPVWQCMDEFLPRSVN